MAAFPHLLLLLLLQQSAAAVPEFPRRIEIEATSAVEGDSVAVVVARWTSRLNRDANDWPAAFGLATIARLTYDYPTADSAYAALHRVSAPDAAPFVAGAYLGAGLAAHLRGMNAAADSAFTHAIEYAHRSGQRDLEAGALIGLASVRSRTAGPVAAAALVERASGLVPRSDWWLESQVRCARAVMLQMAGKAGAGEAEARAGVELAIKAGNRRLSAGCSRLLAVFTVDRGQLDSGLTMFQDALDRLQALGDRATLSTGLQWRGYNHSISYQLGPARLDELRAVEEARASGARSPEAWALLNLCHISTWAGDLTSAVDYCEQSGALFRAQDDRWGLGALLGMQGQLAYLAGDRNVATTLIQRALDEALQIGYAPPIVALRVALASLALDRHDVATAERQLGEARKVARAQRLDAWDQGLAYSYARIAVQRGQLDVAASELRRGLSAVANPEGRYQWMARLADVLIRQGRVDEAQDELQRATAALDSVRAQLTERELRIAVLQSLRDAEDPNLGIPRVLAGLVAGGRIYPAFELAERRKARSLLERIVVRESFRRPTGDSEARHDSLAGFSRVASPSEVAAALPDDRTALLEYVTGTDGARTTVFIITRTGLTAVLLAPLDSLEGDIRRLVTLMEAGENPTVLGRKLGLALLTPAINTLEPGVNRLVIVPDAGLQRLPFEAVMLEDGRPVVARFAVSLVPSASLAARLWGRKSIDTGSVRLLALGDPQFQGEVTPTGEASIYRSAFAANGGLPRLIASADEVRAIARLAPGSEVRLREDASEAFLKRASLERYNVIHFAAHALVDDQAPTRTALALAPGDGEDGFVTPGDLSALNLKADLVVLSACRTANGVFVRGEGVEGLTAPLLQAGARAVVASLWRVGDRSAADFVTVFYRHLADGNRR